MALYSVLYSRSEKLHLLFVRKLTLIMIGGKMTVKHPNVVPLKIKYTKKENLSCDRCVKDIDRTGDNLCGRSGPCLYHMQIWGYKLVLEYVKEVSVILSVLAAKPFIKNCICTKAHPFVQGDKLEEFWNAFVCATCLNHQLILLKMVRYRQ